MLIQIDIDDIDSSKPIKKLEHLDIPFISVEECSMEWKLWYLELFGTEIDETSQEEDLRISKLREDENNISHINTYRFIIHFIDYYFRYLENDTTTTSIGFLLC